jgi:hypothetical protein
VSASTVYLIRSLGTVWGVAATSAIVQTTLSVRLPDALGDIPDKPRVRPFRLCWPPLGLVLVQVKLTSFTAQVIDDIRHSLSALKDLSPELQLKARLVYYDGLRYSFAASTSIALLAVAASCFASGRGLRSTK